MKSIYIIAHAHIDPVWLWNSREGISEVIKTFSRMSQFLETHKDVSFVASSSYFYEWISKINPELYEKVKKLITNRRWEIVGGWVVEPDCNIPWGESFVRHSLYGSKSIKELFNKEIRVGFNPDSFGHNAMLPQILLKSERKYYVFMRPNQSEKQLPSPLFYWRSPDGSKILAYRIPYTYNAKGKQIAEVMKKIIEEYGNKHETLAIFIGAGDHGGGIDEDDIKVAYEAAKAIGVEVKFGTLEDFFSEVERLEGNSLPVIADELQYHSIGCYSVVHEVKELNRKAEHWLISAERVATLAYLLGKNYDVDKIEEAWKSVLFNQFHDVLAGTAIEEVYKGEVKGRFYKAISFAEDLMFESIKYIERLIRVEDDNSFIVWNLSTHKLIGPIDVEIPITIDPNNARIIDPEKGEIPYTRLPIKSKTYSRRLHVEFLAEIPPLGYKVYKIVNGERKKAEGLSYIDNGVANNGIKIKIEDNGLSIYYDSQLIIKGMRPYIIEDLSDTWSHGIDRYSDKGEEATIVETKTEVNESSAKILVKWKFRNSSYITITAKIYPYVNFIYLDVIVDWHEKLKLLKLLVPINRNVLKIRAEIPYGWIDRSETEIERPFQRWLNIITDKGNLIIANDSVYAYDFKNNMIRLTLLRSPPFAYHIPYKLQPDEEFSATDQGEHHFRFIISPEGDEVLATELASVLNSPIIYTTSFKKEGELPSYHSFLSVSPTNVSLEVMKISEDKKDDIILRLYEVSGRESDVKMQINGKEISTNIKPFEIKTLRTDREFKNIREVSLLEN